MHTSRFFITFATSNKKINKTMSKITFKKPFAVIFEGVMSNRTVFVSEINILRSGKPSFVRNKEQEKFNYEFLDETSKEKINEIVERNKKHL